ncbi:hypothetical protein SK128_025320 [Halocaridina rubra]|uniref:Reverse transcriptase Ty1/copia-type domain-containing protein n=1 Tax=Halocaridina rubra TaxID=373956 RepID=A0AAN8WX92_HALRR
MKKFLPQQQRCHLKTFIQVAANLKLRVKQMDIKTAYLNTPIDHDIYVQQTKGYEVKTKDESMIPISKSPCYFYFLLFLISHERGHNPSESATHNRRRIRCRCPFKTKRFIRQYSNNQSSSSSSSGWTSPLSLCQQPIVEADSTQQLKPTPPSRLTPHNSLAPAPVMIGPA